MILFAIRIEVYLFDEGTPASEGRVVAGTSRRENHATYAKASPVLDALNRRRSSVTQALLPVLFCAQPWLAPVTQPTVAGYLTGGGAATKIRAQIHAKTPKIQACRAANSKQSTCLVSHHNQPTTDSILEMRLEWLVIYLHVEVAAWADTYAALFANFALTPNCVCHVQPVRAEQPSEFGALARQGRVTGYPSDNHRITIFLSGLFLCFLNVGDRENASAVRAFGCGV